MSSDSSTNSIVRWSFVFVIIFLSLFRNIYSGTNSVFSVCITFNCAYFSICVHFSDIFGVFRFVQLHSLPLLSVKLSFAISRIVYYCPTVSHFNILSPLLCSVSAIMTACPLAPTHFLSWALILPHPLPQHRFLPQPPPFPLTFDGLNK
jgi:hypothetical protein